MKLLAGVMVLSAATTARADDVLVWLDAKLATDAKGGGDSVALATTKRDLGNAMVMHVVSTAGDLVELEPVTALACTEYRVAPPVELATFRIYVAKADLAPVVTTAWRDSWKDGGYIALEAGTPLGTQGADRVVALGEDRLPVDVPAKLVGDRYAGHAVKAPPQPPGNGDVYLLDGDVNLGKHVVKVAWSAAKVTSAGKAKTAFPFAARCVKGAVVVDAKAVEKGGIGTAYDGAGVGGTLGKGMSSADRWFLPKGTKLTAKSGTHVVGTLAEEIDIPKPTDPAAAVCRDYTVGIAGGPRDSKPATLVLCAPGSVVKSEIRSRF